MKQRDFQRFKQAITATSELYSRSVSEAALLMWWKALERFDIEQVEDAFAQAIQNPDNGQFMPKPADLIRVLEGTRTDRSLIAWGKALDAMQRAGAYSSVVFDDPVIHAVIEDLGGWIKVCRGELGELGYVEHRFCESYRAYASRPVPTEYPAMLVGAHEIQNRTNGRRVAPPVLIGNPERAQDVLRLGGTGPKTQITIASAVAPAMARLEQTT